MLSIWNYAPDVVIKSPTESPTYDLERVKFQRCSLEATTIQRVNFSGSQSEKTTIGFGFLDVFSLLCKVTSQCKQKPG